LIIFVLTGFKKILTRLLQRNEREIFFKRDLALSTLDNTVIKVLQYRNFKSNERRSKNCSIESGNKQRYY